MSRDKPVLETRNLTHSFGDGGARKQVLHDVSVGVRAGETCLIIGPSGSGKSTLLAILSGLLRPDAGRVVALGEELGRLSGAALKEFRRRHCGFIFQGYNLFPALTARQQLEIVLLWGEGASTREARRRSDEMLALLGLESRAGLRFPISSPGGEKQRVAIGRALIKGPSFCFADEPTSALDWEHGRHAVELLTDAARRRQAAVLVVSHDPRVIPYADRVLHLEDGRLSRSRAACQVVREEHAMISRHWKGLRALMLRRADRARPGVDFLRPAAFRRPVLRGAPGPDRGASAADSEAGGVVSFWVRGPGIRRCFPLPRPDGSRRGRPGPRERGGGGRRRPDHDLDDRLARLRVMSRLGRPWMRPKRRWRRRKRIPRTRPARSPVKRPL